MTRSWSLAELKAAWAHCSRNRAAIERSERCGCFACCAVFPPSEIEEWIEEEEWVEESPLRRRRWVPVTAECPRCGVDSVLGDVSALPVTDGEFLRAMRRHFL